MPGKALLSDAKTEADTARCSGLPTTRLSQHPNALPIGSQIEDYRIDKVLGAGGFGITYRAVDMQLKTHVAIKEYFPLLYACRAEDGVSVVASERGREITPHEVACNFDWGIERYLEEARLLARIRHPNVVRVSRYFLANGSAYIVMDYEEGQVLGEILGGRRTLPESQIIVLLRQLLSALDVVHEQGFLHRDIKPDNLLVRVRDDSLVLIDFGAARGTFDTSSRQVTCLVTPGYSPPEQYASNSARYGPRTDIYSLGAVLYRCISGIVPPPAAERLMEDEMPAPAEVAESDYSKGLLDIIARTLALRPQDRFQSVAEIRAALDAETPRQRALPPPLCAAPSEGGSPPAAARRRVPACRQLLPNWARVASLVRAAVAGRKAAVAAVCLLVLGAAVPMLWQASESEISSPPRDQPPRARTLAAPDLSGLEPIPIVPSLTVLAAGEFPAEAEDEDAGSPLIAEDSRAYSEQEASPAAAETVAEADEAAASDGRIAKLLELARNSLEDYRLSVPPKRNAQFYFGQILELDPNHPEARTGDDQIAARYAELAGTKLQRGQRSEAGRLVKLGLGFDADNAELLRLQEALAAKPAERSRGNGRDRGFLADVKRFLTVDLPAASSGEHRDLELETTNR